MKLCSNSKIAFYCFTGSSVETFIIFLIGFVALQFKFVFPWNALFAILNCLGIIASVAWIYKRNNYAYQVAWRSCLLGEGFAFGLLIVLFANSTWKVSGIYFVVLCFFHFSEYFIVSVMNPKTLSLNSFLLNHSREYTAAAVLSWAEFIFERHLFPHLKQIWWFSLFGFFLCVAGEVIRKTAMITAGANFNHVIQSHREEGHILVTHGIYSQWRHPSYVGWFLWSLGTQVILINPICIVGYAIASWIFFNKRIKTEEISLLNFFGEDYVSYQKRVRTGIPFVKGYRVEL